MTNTLEKSADRLIELATRQAACIAALEAALQVIIAKCERGIWSEIDAAREIARTALDKEPGK